MGLWDRLRDALAAKRHPTGPLMPHAVTRIEYDRTPRPEWQAALDATHVPGTARLYLAWEPGDVWQPIHRWFLWQLQPWHLSDDVARKQELRGPHPRTNAQLVYLPATINGRNELRPRLKGGPCTLIDRRTWELHRQIERETGELVIPRRLWVIQGDAGGHPFMVSSEDQALRTLQGVPDVPAAGDLPYAEFSPLVLKALERYDLWRWANGRDPMTAHVRAHVNRLRDTELEANKLRWTQWDDFTREMADGMAFAARKDGLHRLRLDPVGTRRTGRDEEREKDRYLNDFNVEAVA